MSKIFDALDEQIVRLNKVTKDITEFAETTRKRTEGSTQIITEPAKQGMNKYSLSLESEDHYTEIIETETGKTCGTITGITEELIQDIESIKIKQS